MLPPTLAIATSSRSLWFIAFRDWIGSVVIVLTIRSADRHLPLKSNEGCGVEHDLIAYIEARFDFHQALVAHPDNDVARFRLPILPHDEAMRVGPEADGADDGVHGHDQHLGRAFIGIYRHFGTHSRFEALDGLVDGDDGLVEFHVGGEPVLLRGDGIDGFDVPAEDTVGNGIDPDLRELPGALILDIFLLCRLETIASCTRTLTTIWDRSGICISF